jgi:predicted RecA/RadA family phage recombinase
MMEARFVHEGKAIDYTPNEDISAGTVVTIFELIGIAHRDMPAGQPGALSVQGVYEVVKAVGAGKTIPEGSRIYWDGANKIASDVLGEGIYMGKAVKSAYDDDATVLVRLEQ